MSIGAAMEGIHFAWLEITGKCQLECTHCYADSGPTGTHGSLMIEDWLRVIDQLADGGVRAVQFIGGEPTLHPGLPGLVNHARRRQLIVEVFSNLVHVPPGLWRVFEQSGVSLATSYYSDDAAEHAAITRRPTHGRTRANIAEAVDRGIPVRAGVLDLAAGQRSEQAQQELVSLGVDEIGTDTLRKVGRGAGSRAPSASQLCGSCTSGVIAISPQGTVWPCVFARWMPLGNVLDHELADILTGPDAQAAHAELDAEFVARVQRETPCVPRMCDPQCGPSCGPACNPSCWPTKTGPCRPKGGCVPNYGPAVSDGSVVVVFAPRWPVAALSSVGAFAQCASFLRLATNHLDHESH